MMSAHASSYMLIDVQVHCVLAQRKISWKRVLEQRCLFEPGVGHEIEEHALAVVPHLHRYPNNKLLIHIGQPP